MFKKNTILLYGESCKPNRVACEVNMPSYQPATQFAGASYPRSCCSFWIRACAPADKLLRGSNTFIIAKY